MGEVNSTEIPQDWYRSAFPPEETLKRPWADRTGAEVDRALAMLGAQGGERVLDMACGTGRHSHELARRGFEVVGVDISPDLLAIAEADAPICASSTSTGSSISSSTSTTARSATSRPRRRTTAPLR
jgi:2-polyprenyl-3-methyl-5-hydroxy-6-metoxy-1,4-benzoquinol methylase